MYLRLLFMGLICCHMVIAQKKVFSGELHKVIRVTSHVNNISSEDWMRFIVEGDSSITYHSRWGSKTIDKYYTNYIPANGDSNFLHNYHFDTLFSIKKGRANKGTSITIEHLPTTFLGYECNKIIISSTTYRTEKLFLDSSIYENGNSVCLKSKYTDSFYTEEYEVYKIEETNVSDSIFQLPNLPKRQFVWSSIYQSPMFKGGDKSWTQHLKSNLNAELGIKYITIAPSEKSAKVSVFLKFALDKTGTVANVIVTNPLDVHPMLAKEAIRVLMLQPHWLPATYLGQPIPYLLSQKIIFARNAD